jgi:multiple sugar transport system substrate-binding protein
VTKIIQSPTISIRQVKELYPDVVGKNVIINNEIYGLPLSLESLIMLYNKDILNQSGITEAPTDWQVLNEDVQKITRFDTNGKIIQSGAAMGTGTNVNHAMAILSVLMLQSGSPMINNQGLPSMFENTTNEKDPDFTALNFYKAFASPDKSVYSWNPQMPFSLNAFMAGSVGFIFGYNYNVPTIRAQAPKINLGVAPIPQLNPGTPSNYADYALEVVSKKTSHSDEAWDFLLFASSAREVATKQNKEVKKFLDVTKRPAALRSLINTQLEDEDLHAAATQTLTATNWYRGKDFTTAETAFDQMLDQGLTASDSNQLRDIMQTGMNKVTQTY